MYIMLLTVCLEMDDETTCNHDIIVANMHMWMTFPWGEWCVCLFCF